MQIRYVQGAQARNESIGIVVWPSKYEDLYRLASIKLCDNSSFFVIPEPT